MHLKTNYCLLIELNLFLCTSSLVRVKAHLHWTQPTRRDATNIFWFLIFLLCSLHRLFTSQCKLHYRKIKNWKMSVASGVNVALKQIVFFIVSIDWNIMLIKYNLLSIRFKSCSAITFNDLYFFSQSLKRKSKAVKLSRVATFSSEPKANVIEGHWNWLKCRW